MLRFDTKVTHSPTMYCNFLDTCFTVQQWRGKKKQKKQDSKPNPLDAGESV